MTPSSTRSGLYVSGRFGEYAWSPDGQALTVANEGTITSRSIADGKTQTLVNLMDFGKDTASWLRWSPDGKSLAFKAAETGRPGQTFIYRVADGRIEKIVDDSRSSYFFWSPDGQWISFESEETIKIRPEGILWELDTEEALAKLMK